jgi:desulfoferrodoxin (superoxide reductase-like protein)
MLEALKPLFRPTGCCTFVALVLLFTPPAVLADKTSASINAPASAAPGSEITIRVTATHSANNFLHYTDWLSIMVNGKEIARWNYTRTHKPESNVFTREIKFVVNEPLELKAEGHCNMHGSKGPATANVAIAPAAE